MVSTCLKLLLTVFIPPDAFDGTMDQILTAPQKVGTAVGNKVYNVWSSWKQNFE